MGSVVLGCAGLVGVVFAVAASSKLRPGAFQAFVASLGQLVPLPISVRRSVAIAVVVGEGAVVAALAGWALTGGNALRGLGAAGFGLAAALLSIFTAALGAAVKNGRPASCRCFGAAETPVGIPHLLGNLVLLCAAGAGLAGTLAGVSMPAHWESGLLTLSASATLALLVIRLDDIVALFS